MSYKERLLRLEKILHVDKLSKKYNLKPRPGNCSSPTADNHSSSSAGLAEQNDNNVEQQEMDSEPDKFIGSDNKEQCCDNEGGEEGEEEQEQYAINLSDLKKLVFHGLPGDSEYRALVWRLLLNYLPPNSFEVWDEYMAKKRNNYNHFVEDLLLLDQSRDAGGNAIPDHPLNPEPDSKWQIFFKDNDVLLQIDKDVRRLCPEISFFQTQTQYPNELIQCGKMDRLHKRVQSCVLESSNVIRKGLGITKMMVKESGQSPSSSTAQCTFGSSQSSNTATPQGCSSSSNISSSDEPMQRKNSNANSRKESVEEQGEYHWEVVERILFIYAKLNPGQSYVQGMNEIIGPIYYTLANDANVSWRAHAEADTFYLFTNLMGEIRDFFIRSLDNSVSGIKRMMELLMERLKLRDHLVHDRLVLLEIHPQYYAFRWITLLMSQEFALPEVLRIWDSLLSDTKRFDFLIDLATAMIIHIRSDLLSGDFPSNMKLLQNYPPIDVRDILSLANSFSSTSPSSSS